MDKGVNPQADTRVLSTETAFGEMSGRRIVEWNTAEVRADAASPGRRSKDLCKIHKPYGSDISRANAKLER